jgi:UDP-2,4-diacetamido-2,4,6-trideoxy-beta-L-altropyranose hydrolase
VTLLVTNPSGAAILLRADGGVEMGTGHVMRCLALAQAWQDRGGTATFAMAAPPPPLVQRLQSEGIATLPLGAAPGSPQDAQETLEAVGRLAAAWVVLDGYHFGDTYQKAIHDGKTRLLAVDDYGHASHYWADLVLNQDLNAEEELYRRREPYTRLLLGTQYVLLRREFRRAARPRREAAPTVGRLLVTLGGSDPQNVTLGVLRAVALAELAAEVVVLIGPSNPHAAALEAEVGRTASAIRLLRNPPNIPEIMAESDMAVTAGGSTVWELARFAVPSIVLVLAENQRPSSRMLAARGGCLLMEDEEARLPAALAAAIRRLAEGPSERARIGRTIGALVDGGGADRVCEEMEKTAGPAAESSRSGVASRSSLTEANVAESG